MPSTLGLGLILIKKEVEMNKEISVVTIHGMGNTERDYYKPLERKLKKYVGTRTWNTKVHLESVFYQDLLQGNQEDYWDKSDDKYNLKWDFLRKFMLFGFSDAGSIEHSLHDDLALYKAVHAKIADALDKCLAKLGDANKPVFLICHSLGCEQLSNYIWDSQHEQRYFKDDVGTQEQKTFRRLKSCKALITTGCNIPIFKAGLEHAKLFSRLNDDFEWHNYFDSSDVLGYPMQHMSPSYKVNWLKDHRVKVGNFLTGWNPLSHGGYWEDKDVLKPIAKMIQSCI